VGAPGLEAAMVGQHVTQDSKPDAGRRRKIGGGAKADRMTSIKPQFRP